MHSTHNVYYVKLHANFARRSGTPPTLDHSSDGIAVERPQVASTPTVEAAASRLGASERSRLLPLLGPPLNLYIAEQIHEVYPAVRWAYPVAILDPLQNLSLPGVELLACLTPPAAIAGRTLVGDDRVVEVIAEDSGQELTRQRLLLRHGQQFPDILIVDLSAGFLRFNHNMRLKRRQPVDEQLGLIAFLDLAFLLKQRIVLENPQVWTNLDAEQF